MKKFLYPCFVRVEDAEQRKYLIEWLEMVEYKNYGNPFQHTDFSKIFTTIDGKYVPYNVPCDNSWIDCGLNIELFKAISAINDTDCVEQWFIWDTESDIGDKWRKFDDNPNWNWWKFECHKATTEEIIEHFTK